MTDLRLAIPIESDEDLARRVKERESFASQWMSPILRSTLQLHCRLAPGVKWMAGEVVHVDGIGEGKILPLERAVFARKERCGTFGKKVPAAKDWICVSVRLVAVKVYLGREELREKARELGAEGPNGPEATKSSKVIAANLTGKGVPAGMLVQHARKEGN